MTAGRRALAVLVRSAGAATCLALAACNGDGITEARLRQAPAYHWMQKRAFDWTISNCVRHAPPKQLGAARKQFQSRNAAAFARMEKLISQIESFPLIGALSASRKAALQSVSLEWYNLADLRLEYDAALEKRMHEGKPRIPELRELTSRYLEGAGPGRDSCARFVEVANKGGFDLDS